MFEAAELGHSVDKAEYERQVPELRLELLTLQRELRGADFPVIVVFGGVHGAGKSETINLLNEWMDPRWIVTRAYGEPSDEERERPAFWRYWRDLPPEGRFGLFLSSWYSRPVLDRVYRKISRSELDEQLEEIVAFERALADDGALILKFWMHLGKKAQKKRLKALEKEPLQRWRVTKLDWKHWQKYDKFVGAAELTLTRTSTGQTPWTIVEGADPRYRSLAVATRIRDAVRRRLHADKLEQRLLEEVAEMVPAVAAADSPSVAMLDDRTILQALEMDLSLSRKAYPKTLSKEQGRLNLLSRQAQDKGLSAILVFEGWDAAGKGSAVRRLTGALDARGYQVIPIGAPNDEERAHHYLWRFWRHISRAGRITIFDRSWYGRVLVERVEGFASREEWMRAYAEINHFEEQLVQSGIVLCKFWLHITKDEQLRRFQAREQTPYKAWKLTPDDWRNRERWEDYELAVNDMVERTSTRLAPWTLVEANDKRFARVKVIRTLSEQLERALT